MLRSGDGECVVSDHKGGFEMATIYSNGEDERARGGYVKPSRFSPRYRKLSPDEVALHDEIKTLAAKLEFAIEKTKKNRERSMAITKLEESIMWAIKGLTK